MKKVNRVFIIILVALIGVGLGLLIWVLCANEQAIKKVELSSEGETYEELSFSAETFLPGDRREYTVALHSGEEGAFEVVFSCKSVSGGDLWQYLDFGISCGEMKKEVAFADMKAGATLAFDVELKKDAAVYFTVTYAMPLDIGNEAMGETTDFVLLLKARRK